MENITKTINDLIFEINLRKKDGFLTITTKGGYLANFEDISEEEVLENLNKILEDRNFWKIKEVFSENGTRLGDEPRWDNVTFLTESND